MSPEESDHFAKTTPENIIPTNMLDKWKLQDDGTVAAKSRSVLVGWKDPIIYQLERAAPTPTHKKIMVTLQWLASAKVTGRIADLTNAFGQARKKSRNNKLATKLHSWLSCLCLHHRARGEPDMTVNNHWPRAMNSIKRTGRLVLDAYSSNYSEWHVDEKWSSQE